MEEKQRKTVGDNIRFYRMKRGFTQQDLANILGVKYQQIQAWEKSGYKGGRNPKRENLEKIASVLGVKLYDLYPEEDKELNSVVENELQSRLRWIKRDSDGRMERIDYNDLVERGLKIDAASRATHAFLQLDEEHKHIAVILLVEVTNKCMKKSAGLEFKHYLDALLRATENDSGFPFTDITNNYDELLNDFANQIEALAELYQSAPQDAPGGADDKTPAEK